MKTWAYAGLVLTLLVACTNVNRPQVLSGTLANTPYVAATADMRFVFARPKPPPAASSTATGLESTNSSLSAADPNFTVCAEPSPDVAKALADALTASANITADGLKALGSSGASVTVNPSISAIENSSLSELGRRLATTQLLRDGVYRLCEAYSNGAISSTEYALVLSRYGDTMVTLLAIEAVTGMADSQQPASAAAGASAPAVPSTPSVPKAGAGGGSAAGKPTSSDTKSGPPDSSANGLLNISVRHISPTLFDNPSPRFVKVADRPSTEAGQDGHAAPPTRSSGATANGTNVDKVAAANAVIRLQENYLKQSAYAPLIVLCADTLAKTPSGPLPKNSMAENCVNVLNTFVEIQAARLTEEARSYKAADAEKPSSGAVVTKRLPGR